MNAPKIHIGCSAFYNSYWKGVFYPLELPSKKWFDYYCEHFSTFEINATFYKFPTAKVIENWYNKAPKDFVYAVKAPKIITHLKRFEDCELEIDSFYEVIKTGLREKLGPVLFQLPPSFAYTPERLKLILKAMNANFNNVVEFRHSSWWQSDVYQKCTEKNITFCSVSYPKLSEELVATTKIGYVRLHGVPKLFYSSYDKSDLENLKIRIKEQKWDEVFVYFNNTVNTAGILNAVTMKKSLNEI